jgi:hypothetical protein
MNLNHLVTKKRFTSYLFLCRRYYSDKIKEMVEEGNNKIKELEGKIAEAKKAQLSMEKLDIGHNLEKGIPVVAESDAVNAPID